MVFIHIYLFIYLFVSFFILRCVKDSLKHFTVVLLFFCVIKSVLNQFHSSITVRLSSQTNFVVFVKGLFFPLFNFLVLSTFLGEKM